jgi:hypothetical protein
VIGHLCDYAYHLDLRCPAANAQEQFVARLAHRKS